MKRPPRCTVKRKNLRYGMVNVKYATVSAKNYVCVHAYVCMELSRRRERKLPIAVAAEEG